MKQGAAPPSAKACPPSKHFPQSCPNIRSQSLDTECCRFLLCDFGISKSLNRRHEFELQEGDERYVSPEFTGNFDQGRLDLAKKDIYGAGMIALEMMTFQQPATRKSTEWSAIRNRATQIRWLDETSYSPKLKSAILDCLSENPLSRPPAGSVIKILHCVQQTSQHRFQGSCGRIQTRVSAMLMEPSCTKPTISYLWKSSSASKCHDLKYKSRQASIEEVFSQKSQSSGKA